MNLHGGAGEGLHHPLRQRAGGGRLCHQLVLRSGQRSKYADCKKNPQLIEVQFCFVHNHQDRILMLRFTIVIRSPSEVSTLHVGIIRIRILTPVACWDTKQALNYLEGEEK